MLLERIAAHRTLVVLEVALLRAELRSRVEPTVLAFKAGSGITGWAHRMMSVFKFLRNLRQSPVPGSFPWATVLKVLAVVPPAVGIWRWWGHRHQA